MPHGVFAKKSDFLEIGEYNFTWPGENGTFHDFGSVNYTMPSGKYRNRVLFVCLKQNYTDFKYLQDLGIGRGVHFGERHNIHFFRSVNKYISRMD